MLATTYALFLRRELPARQTIVLTAASLLPAALAVLVRAFGSGAEFLEKQGGPLIFLGPMVLVPVFYAVSAFHEEFESRTIVYLLTRPPTRWSYVVGKFLTAWTCSVLSVGIGVIAMGIVCAWGRSELGYFAATTGKMLVAASLGAGVYCALFLVFGILVRNPVVVGLVFTFGWEYLVGILPGQLQLWTLGVYPKSIFIRWADCDPAPYFPWASRMGGGLGATPGLPAMATSFLLTPDMELPTIGSGILVSLGLMAGLLFFAVRLFEHREDA